MITDNKNDNTKPTATPSAPSGQGHKVEEKKDAVKPAFAGKTDEQTVVGDKKSAEGFQSPSPEKKV